MFGKAPSDLLQTAQARDYPQVAEGDTMEKDMLL